MKSVLSFAALSFAALSGLTAAAQEPKIYRDAEQAFLERTSLRAADEKCKYFTDLERSALISGQLQSRGVLLRAGFDSADIDKAADEVRLYANTQPCGSADFMAARSHLKNAFSAFIGTMVMDYPGVDTVWSASRSRWDTWRVVQNGSHQAFPYQFGLLAPVLTDPFQLALEIILPKDMQVPSLARILLRDEMKSPAPWLGTIFGNEPGPPPHALTKAYWASGRELIEDEKTGERKLRFSFSPATTAAIEKLDPRERFQIAITPNARSTSSEIIYLEIEVGDFAAAHAFTKLPPL